MKCSPEEKYSYPSSSIQRACREVSLAPSAIPAPKCKSNFSMCNSLSTSTFLLALRCTNFTAGIIVSSFFIQCLPIDFVFNSLDIEQTGLPIWSVKCLSISLSVKTDLVRGEVIWLFW